MKPAEAVQALLLGAPDALFISSLGTATAALRAASDDGPHLYLGGAMGSALAVGIGVAAHRPDHRVVAVLGDGELLMGAGSLWTLTTVSPPNLLVAVLGDGHYSITGGQPLGSDPRVVSVLAALGDVSTRVVDDPQAVTKAVTELTGPALLEIRYTERIAPGADPFVDPHVVRARFEAAAGASRHADSSVVAG